VLRPGFIYDALSELQLISPEGATYNSEAVPPLAKSQLVKHKKPWIGYLVNQKQPTAKDQKRLFAQGIAAGTSDAGAP
jgi:hypothetical protein